MNISDNQIFMALYIVFFTGIIALRLGINLYEG